MTIDNKKITVTDTGLGIPESMMPLLYKRFKRLDHNSKQPAEGSLVEEHTSSNVEGTGLGLSIVQRIMTHMGWQLSHQDHKTGGSTFIIYYK